MALETIWIDGFDHMVSADLAAKYDEKNFSTAITNSITRTGPNVLRTSITSTALRKRFAGSQYRTMVAGFALNADNNGDYVFKLTAEGLIQVQLFINSSGLAEIRNGAGTILATGTTVMPLNAWAYIEFEAFIDNTTGWAKVYVDETLDASFTGDTQHQTANYCNEFIITGGLYHYFDDLYVRGDTVETAGGTLGNCKVLTRMPQGAGTYTDLAPTGGANWANVDETTPDGDTTYNSSATIGHKDTYDFAALADTGVILAVQLATYAKKTDTGARSLEPYVKSGVTEQAGTAQSLSTAYRYQTKVWDKDPNTAAAWTEANLDAAEFGVRVA